MSDDSHGVRFGPRSGGSHRQPLNGELHEALDALNTHQFGGTHGHRGIPTPFGVAADELASFCFESMPGDCIAFTENCWHAAFGGADGRQQHAISFQANPRTTLELEHLAASVPGVAVARVAAAARLRTRGSTAAA